jgi:ubiquinone/menaquinone biosynthesis C-methylase UbiE
MVQFLEEIYRRRFGKELAFRQNMGKTLCTHFFQKYVPRDAVVLDVAAGYCEFINHIRAKTRIALDVNTDMKRFAQPGVVPVIESATNMRSIPDGSVDVVFTSNFLEHLLKQDIVKVIQECRRVLKKGGRMLMVQPNYRYCYKDFWMFWDHQTPLDDRSLSEIVEVNGFKVVECRARWLPYTTKGKLPRSTMLLKLYLALPFLQRLFGAQSFLHARRL